MRLLFGTALLSLALIAHGASVPKGIRAPTGHQLLQESIFDVARDYGLGWPSESDNGDPHAGKSLCYRITEASVEIVFLTYSGRGFDPIDTDSAHPAKGPVIKNFILRKAGNENGNDKSSCEPIRNSKAKDFIIEGFWVGQSVGQVDSRLSEIGGKITGERCRQFDEEVPFDRKRLRSYQVHDGNPTGTPSLTERFGICLELDDEKLKTLYITSELLPTSTLQ